MFELPSRPSKPDSKVKLGSAGEMLREKTYLDPLKPTFPRLCITTCLYKSFERHVNWDYSRA